MKKILVTGAGGQLAESIRTIGENYKGLDFYYTGIADLDLTDRKKTTAFFGANRFDCIVNCAAYTTVDKAEQEKAAAYSVNSDVPALLGTLAMEQGILLVHISTDYVFDGLSPFPYSESAITNPLSVYGKSKLEGELALRDNPDAIIIRTSWLYSEYGDNFLKTMLRLGNERQELGVVFDQTGCPTYAPDLAEAIVHIAGVADPSAFPAGIYHYANEGVASWFDFAWEIMQMAGLGCRVRPITTGDYPLPAKRPQYSVLNISKIRSLPGIKTFYWKTSLNKAVARLVKI